MRNPLQVVLICLLASSTVVLAQDVPPAAAVPSLDRPLTADNESLFGGLQKILIRSAESMPEENYGFRPVETVRSFGQIVGHVADSQYAFCSAVLGEENPALNIEKTRSSKADLVAALKDAFAYCDRAYEGMTDASGSESVRFMRREKAKLGVLTVNQVHTGLHYGNLVTYLRMNGVVPPSSEPEFMKQLMK